MTESDKQVELEQFRRKKYEKTMSEKLSQELEEIRRHDTIAKARFLEAWKRGIEKTGSQFFSMKCGIAEATDKWQLTPNYEFIDTALGALSHGHQVFLALMYSFYNSEDGQKLLERVGVSNVVDVLPILDLEGRKIFSELCLYYEGW